MVDIVQLALEPADMLREAAPDWCAREAEAIFLGDEHVEERTPPRQERIQRLRSVIGQWPRLGANALRKEGEDVGIDGIGLGELSRGACEVAYLAEIDDDERQPGRGEGGYDGVLEAPSCLERDQGRRVRLSR